MSTAVVGESGEAMMPVGCAAPAPEATAGLAKRVVAVATGPMELLRPESDLARQLAGFAHVDVLLATDDSVAEDDDDDEGDDDVRDQVAKLGHPELVVHRLALSRPLGPAAEEDLVAAVSELVGFDPEAGVYCLAPALPSEGASVPDDSGRIAVSRAAQRIARVYGLPLLRYRCLELSVVELSLVEKADDAVEGYDTV